MRYERNAEGFYFRDNLLNDDWTEGVVKQHLMKLCPVDSTSAVTWAQTLLQKGQDAIDVAYQHPELGWCFGICHDGDHYDLSNFMCDTHGGDVPWSDAGPKGYKAMYEAMQAEPNFIQVLDDFFKKFGQPYFYKTWEVNYAACQGEEPEYHIEGEQHVAQ